MLESIEKHFITNHEIKLNELNQTLIQHDSHGHHHGSNVTDHNHHSSKHDNHQAHLIFHVLEMIFKYTSITILGMFVVEFIVKLIFTPRVFIKVWEILDALVVVISFGLNIYLINQDLGMSVLFITILRLWRIFEIVNGK